ncbi:MAG: thiolase family protein [Candidatus Baltobacteraceae bacterium]|jgi:acetyl-CoA C-acetyltransferase
MKSKTVVLATARTPFGRLGGALAPFKATVLGGEAIRAALQRSGLDPAEVEYVVMGQALLGGVGQAPARQAAYVAGLAKTVACETVSKVCASGMMAIACGARLIAQDDAAVVVAGGMESMSNGPYAAFGARFGLRFGDGALVDLTSHDGLVDPWSGDTMAQAQTKVNADLGITRAVQDEFAYTSQQRAAQATAAGLLRDEVVPLKVAAKPKGKLVVDALPAQVGARIPVHAGSSGNPNAWSHESAPDLVPDLARTSPYVTGERPYTLVERDEPIRPETTLEALAALPPLERGGTVTAGNAPGVNDGAAALVLTSADYAKSHGCEPLGEIVDHAAAGWDPAYIALTPSMAVARLLEKQGIKVSDVAVWEVNEAFAAIAWCTAQQLGLDPKALNLLGGAVAMGHPVGASGARITASVIHQLRRRGGGLGVAAICSGGGQGDAMLVKVG